MENEKHIAAYALIFNAFVLTIYFFTHSAFLISIIAAMLILSAVVLAGSAGNKKYNLEEIVKKKWNPISSLIGLIVIYPAYIVMSYSYGHTMFTGIAVTMWAIAITRFLICLNIYYKNRHEQ